VRITDECVYLNDRIAAALTRWVGSMWTVYATLAIVAAWIGMATLGPLRRVDPYPFAFMLFLGNVVQLLLCFVILVGQRARPGRRSAGAADLRECRGHLRGGVWTA